MSKLSSFLVAAFAVLVALSACSTYMRVASIPVPIASLLKPVVKIKAGPGMCSASVIQSDDNGTYLLTAAHCVSASKTGILPEFLDPPKFYVVAYNKLIDTAIIKIPDGSLRFKTVTLSSRRPVEGDRLTAVGFPMGERKTVTQGFYTARFHLPKVMPSATSGKLSNYMWVSVPIFGGNSGGALYDSGGYQIGIASMMNQQYPQTSLWAPVTDALPMIRRVLPDLVIHE